MTVFKHLYFFGSLISPSKLQICKVTWLLQYNLKYIVHYMHHVDQGSETNNVTVKPDLAYEYS